MNLIARLQRLEARNPSRGNTLVGDGLTDAEWDAALSAHGAVSEGHGRLMAIRWIYDDAPAGSCFGTPLIVGGTP